MSLADELGHGGKACIRKVCFRRLHYPRRGPGREAYLPGFGGIE